MSVSIYNSSPGSNIHYPIVGLEGSGDNGEKESTNSNIRVENSILLSDELEKSYKWELEKLNKSFSKLKVKIIKIVAIFH